nr:hypothetical protein [uncultured Prevotella sp.]
MPLHSGKIGNGGYTREQVNGGEVGRYNANAGGEKLYNNTFSITTIKQESLGGGSCFFRYIIISGEVNVNVVEKRERVVFSIENITFAILICIARFLVKENLQILHDLLSRSCKSIY